MMKTYLTKDVIKNENDFYWIALSIFYNFQFTSNFVVYIIPPMGP